MTVLQFKSKLGIDISAQIEDLTEEVGEVVVSLIFDNHATYILTFGEIMALAGFLGQFKEMIRSERELESSLAIIKNIIKKNAVDKEQKEKDGNK